MRSILSLPLLALATASLPAQWIETSPQTVPSPRRAGAMAYDPVNNRMVIYGGLTASPSQSLAETWIFTTNWQQLTGAAAPARWGHRLITRTTDNRIYGFGGRAPTITSLANDTYKFDGSNWVDIPTAHAPNPRFLHGLAYDSNRDRIVMFGGRTLGGANNETWEFDGTDWTQVLTPNAPSPREEMGMVYDASLGRVVLFGGCNETTQQVFGDTWMYNGFDWVDVTPANSPSPRFRGAMIFDTTRNRSVYFGGYDGQTVLSDTFEYAGDQWLPGTGATSPPNSTENYHAFHRGTNRFIVFGGYGPSFSNETWQYFGSNTGLFSLFGEGCDTGTGVPELSGSIPTIGQPLNLTFSNLGTSVAVAVVLGLSNQSFAAGPLPFDLGLIGLPGCNLLVSPDLLAAELATAGTANYSLGLPAQPNLVGQSIFCQGLALDLAPGLVFVGATRGGRALIGQ